MSTDTMKQAQAAIKSALDFYSVMFGTPVDSVLVTHHSEAKALFEKCMAAMESLSQALEQPAPAQEPVPSIIQMLGHCPECGAKAHHFTKGGAA